MKSLWNDADAARDPSPLGLRVYTSRLLGREPSLVLHGGGNTSVKTRVKNLFGEEEEVLYIKGSGWDLATIEAAGFAPVRLDVVRRMADLPSLSDTEMVRAQRAAMTDPNAPTPSVEAILHAIIPFAFVDHSHADAVVAVSNTEGGERRIREIYGDDVLIVPYVMPGFVLARRVRELTRSTDWRRLKGIVLLNHGVFSFSDDARASYEEMLALVTRAERYLERQGALGGGRGEMTGGGAKAAGTGTATASGSRGGSAPIPPDGATPASLARLRRELGRAKGGPVIARLDSSPDAVAFSNRPDVAAIATRGPLTPDHVIRTKPVALVAAGHWAAEVAGYGERYRAYFERHKTAGLTCLDPAPRWIVWPGHGIVAVGGSAREAAIAADITRHTARAIGWAEPLGGWKALPEKDLFEVEYWELEQAKLRQGGARPQFAGKVALVTGAASGIGRACAEALAAHGAAVVATDVNAEIEKLFAKEGLVGIVADATDRDAVRRSVEECVARFGGLDIVVSNAGFFSPSQPIGAIAESEWERSLSLNLSSHLYLLEAARPYLALGFDPAVVFIGSKNVPAPGPGAAAYSVAKAGLAQLARVAALELAKEGIRVNTVHPHLVIDTAAWTDEVLAARARSYGMTVDQYRSNNLLKVEITTKDVANAVLALAGPTFAKTTGAQIPIDGGSDRIV